MRDLQVAEGQYAHLLLAREALLITPADLRVSVLDRLADEGGGGGVLVAPA